MELIDFFFSFFLIISIIVYLLALYFKHTEKQQFAEKTKNCKKHHIKGIFYRDKSKFKQGIFDGYIKSEPENERDKFAIAIYREDHILLGYIDQYDTTPFHLEYSKEDLLEGNVKVLGELIREYNTHFKDMEWRGWIAIK